MKHKQTQATPLQKVNDKRTQLSEIKKTYMKQDDNNQSSSATMKGHQRRSQQKYGEKQQHIDRSQHRVMEDHEHQISQRL